MSAQVSVHCEQNLSWELEGNTRKEQAQAQRTSTASMRAADHSSDLGIQAAVMHREDEQIWRR